MFNWCLTQIHLFTARNLKIGGQILKYWHQISDSFSNLFARRILSVESKSLCLFWTAFLPLSSFLIRKKITRQVLRTCAHDCVKCECQKMFWRVTLLSNSRNLQVNCVSHEQVNGSWEVTSFFWVWCNREQK